MQVPILSGIVADKNSDFRTRYPRNMVPVPKQLGMSQGFLRPADGLVLFATGLGKDRGAAVFNGLMHRASGDKLITIDAAGVITTIGTIGGSSQTTFDEGFGRLAIASNRNLFYWDGTTLSQVTDTDLGVVLDVVWIDGYFATTDGTSIVVTDLNDPMSVNPLKYGSSEADPDAIVRLLNIRDELIAVNRFTIEYFQNIGGTLFPFQRIPGALISRGAVGTHAAVEFEGSIAFVGGGRNKGKVEPPSVYLGANGITTPISTAEIDQVLQGYTDEQLAALVMEVRSDRAHRLILIHLPDQTLVYDAAASAFGGDLVWFSLTSSIEGLGLYRARNLVWCYGKWLAGDPTSANVAELVLDRSDQFGTVNGWDFCTLMLYNEGDDAIVHEMELVSAPGRVALGKDPTIWTSHSFDGETWSLERPVQAGKQGQRDKRIAWRGQGRVRNYRMQQFRGTSDAHLAIARLNMRIEPLATQHG